MKYITLVITLFLISCAAVDSTKPYIIYKDYGGRLSTYATKLSEIKNQKREIHIIGTCVSACTLYLHYGCVSEKSKIGFHGASVNGRVTTISEIGTRALANTYPPQLKDWFLENAAHLYGDQVVYLSGAEVISMGVKKCS